MARERVYRTEAIVIRRTDHGEADRLLTLFSSDRGKIKAIAKGARKPQSRKTGHVELFMRSQFMLASARSFDVITQADLIEPYRGLSTDLLRMTYASYIAELMDNFTVDEERNGALYGMLSETLGWFAEGDNFMLAARYYELRLLSLTGFQPQFFYCVASGEAIEQENQFFSAELGGFLRNEHQFADSRARRISSAAVKVLRFLQTRSWEAVHELQLRPKLQTELESMMHYYLSHILERRLKSVDFLSRLKREARQFGDPKS